LTISVKLIVNSDSGKEQTWALAKTVNEEIQIYLGSCLFIIWNSLYI